MGSVKNEVENACSSPNVKTSLRGPGHGLETVCVPVVRCPFYRVFHRGEPWEGVPLKRCLLWLWHERDEPTHNHHREQLNPLQLTPIRASRCRLYVIAPLDRALAAGQGHS